MKRTKFALAALALTVSTASQAQYQPPEQNANYHEVREHSMWVWANISNFCGARPHFDLMFCTGGM